MGIVANFIFSISSSFISWVIIYFIFDGTFFILKISFVNSIQSFLYLSQLLRSLNNLRKDLLSLNKLQFIIFLKDILYPKLCSSPNR